MWATEQLEKDSLEKGREENKGHIYTGGSGSSCRETEKVKEKIYMSKISLVLDVLVSNSMPGKSLL